MKGRCFSGFTLIELLIVLSILGVVALVITPTFSSYENDQKFNAAVQEIFTALRYSQSEAVRSGSNVIVRIDTNTENLEVINHIHPADKKEYILDFKSFLSISNVDIVSVGGSFGNVDIIFQADGRPNIGTNIALTFGNYSEIILIDDTTGRVSIQ